MHLESFRVTTFRSVDDSGIIETNGVTALIGINESGKSNLLLPLWKLNPAKDGQIKPTADYPRKSYNDFRNMATKPIFIECIFVPDEAVRSELSKLTGTEAIAFKRIRVRRRFSGEYFITFPDASAPRTIGKTKLIDLLSKAASEIAAITPLKSEEDYATSVKAELTAAIGAIGENDPIFSDALRVITAQINYRDSPAKTSAVAPRYAQLAESLAEIIKSLEKPLPDQIPEARKYALKQLPDFVYYTNYGNLDSEIYLPHVIANMQREDLGAREEAKVRTLKVLFDFVGLKPEEILELGQDFKSPTSVKREPTEEEIAEIAEKKKERSILLQSASTKLTQEFREWWKQGEYRFRFEADGDHFRIWVSDDKRPEEIELEGRSTGLQWFLSFYLVFLVESGDQHAGSILLLDEPGMSLHPLAQRDLSAFFDGLCEDNQIIYTTHSPFLIDADRLDRARKVYIAADGTTKSTPDLKSTEGDKAQRASGYAVHAALGLTVAESLLLGCTTVIVEGLSDQIYLSAIKTMLIASGKLTPGREIIFPPAGGAKGVKAVASILTGRDEDLPVALFDSDKLGDEIAKQLKQGMYASRQDRVLQVGTFAKGVSGETEVEDLMPPELIIQAIDKLQKGSEVSFEDEYKSGSPIVDQIEGWAIRHGLALESPAWKVEVAKRVKASLLSRGHSKVAADLLEQWVLLFQAMQV